MMLAKLAGTVTRWLALVAVLPLGACVQATAPTDTGGGLTLSTGSGRPIPLSYTKDLQPVFAGDCVSCHSGPSPAGGYSMVDYMSVMRDVRPGDPSSPLVVETQPLGRMFQYFSGDRLMKSSMVYTWVVEFDANNNSREDR
jgi:hypothetical protein